MTYYKVSIYICFLDSLDGRDYTNSVHESLLSSVQDRQAAVHHKELRARQKTAIQKQIFSQFCTTMLLIVYCMKWNLTSVTWTILSLTPSIHYSNTFRILKLMVHVPAFIFRLKLLLLLKKFPFMMPGFTEVKAACCGLGKMNAKVACLPISSYCSNRKKYIYWDPNHPTEATVSLLTSTVIDGSPPNVFPVNLRQLCAL